MIDDCNIKKLAKNQVSAVFSSRYSHKCVIQIYRDLYRDAMAAGNQQQHMSLSFATKSVNLSLEELKYIKKILFPIQETVQIAKCSEISPVISHFLTNSAVM